MSPDWMGLPDPVDVVVVIGSVVEVGASVVEDDDEVLVVVALVVVVCVVGVVEVLVAVDDTVDVLDPMHRY